jgi:hypothetical protein
MKTKGSENRKSAHESDSTRPGDKGAKVSGIERVGSHGHQGGVSFPISNHPEVCDVARTPSGAMDK